MSLPPSPVPLAKKNAAPRDRRGSARTPVHNGQALQAFLIVGPQSHPVRLHDLSTRGAGLLLHQTVPVGTQLQLEITNRTRLFTCRRRLRVAHCTSLENGANLIGCEFVTPLDYQQIFALRCR